MKAAMAALPLRHHHTHHKSCCSLASLSPDQTFQQHRMSQQRPQLSPSQLSANVNIATVLDWLLSRHASRRQWPSLTQVNVSKDFNIVSGP